MWYAGESIWHAPNMNNQTSHTIIHARCFLVTHRSLLWRLLHGLLLWSGRFFGYLPFLQIRKSLKPWEFPLWSHVIVLIIIVILIFTNQWFKVILMVILSFLFFVLSFFSVFFSCFLSFSFCFLGFAVSFFFLPSPVSTCGDDSSEDTTLGGKGSVVELWADLP